MAAFFAETLGEGGRRGSSVDGVPAIEGSGRMNMKGSMTEQNLMKAFAGESQARNRYTFYAAVAVEEGYRQIADSLPRDRG